MANRQDSGSNSAHQNQRPTSHNEDRLPENTEATRGGTADDDFEVDDVEGEEEEDEEDEGSF